VATDYGLKPTVFSVLFPCTVQKRAAKFNKYFRAVLFPGREDQTANGSELTPIAVEEQGPELACVAFLDEPAEARGEAWPVRISVSSRRAQRYGHLMHRS
jgi:hypothetical protein